MSQSQDRPEHHQDFEVALRQAGAVSLAPILASLRQLALQALDSGHPIAAAQIAGTADRLEAKTWTLPPRPDYAPR